MGKVKQLKLDRYEHGLLVRALYEEWKQMLDAGADTAAIEDLILRVIDAPTKKRLTRPIRSPLSALFSAYSAAIVFLSPTMQ